MALAHFRAGILAALAFTAPALAADWPQLQNGPARLGYSAEKIDGPLTRAWAVGMAPERLHPQAQPIVAGGKVLIGTEMGNFHAFDARTGKKAWTYKVGGAVLHTAGAEGGTVFFACLDGCVYALALDDGALRWRFDSKMRTGFSTAVLLADGNVYAANRGGTCFALRQADGTVLWRRDVGAAVLMSPALAAGGRVVFGAMDMRVYALDAKTGEVAWRSDVLPGAAFKDYWPVAYKDCVIVRPQKAAGGATGPAIEWLSGPLPQAELDKQQALLDRLAKDPAQGDLFVLDARTGRLAPPVPHWTSCTMNGAVAPPCVDGDGLLIVPVTLHDWRGGWGRLDLDKRRVVEVLAEAGTDPRGQKRGMGNSDENLLPTAAGRVVFAFHTEECNANFTGVWHLDRRDWTQVGPIHAEQCFASNTQGGGGNPVSIAGGMVYHTSWNTLNARVAGPARDASSR
jgi:hypothetical protein